MSRRARSRVYSWIRIPESFFQSDLCRVFQTRKDCDGVRALYVYFWLLAQTLGRDGRLCSMVGGKDAPMDADELSMMCCGISREEMTVYLDVLEDCGLLVRDSSGVLCAAAFTELTGSETAGAVEQRARRAGRAVEPFPWEPPAAPRMRGTAPAQSPAQEPAAAESEEPSGVPDKAAGTAGDTLLSVEEEPAPAAAGAEFGTAPRPDLAVRSGEETAPGAAVPDRTEEETAGGATTRATSRATGGATMSPQLSPQTEEGTTTRATMSPQSPAAVQESAHDFQETAQNPDEPPLFVSPPLNPPLSPCNNIYNNIYNNTNTGINGEEERRGVEEKKRVKGGPGGKGGGGGDGGKRGTKPPALPRSAQDAPAVFSMPCRDGRDFGVAEDAVARWEELYPGLDVRSELRKMVAWLEANAERRKTVRGMPRFINAWLSRSADRRTGGQTWQSESEARYRRNHPDYSPVVGNPFLEYLDT